MLALLLVATLTVALSHWLVLPLLPLLQYLLSLAWLGWAALLLLLWLFAGAAADGPDHGGVQDRLPAGRSGLDDG